MKARAAPEVAEIIMNDTIPIRKFFALLSEEVERPPVKISVIVPVVNEAAAIGAALRQIPQTEDLEVIVVDGGSCDHTAHIAEACGTHVLRTTAGRAHQMNAGAEVARGGILLFLHADTRLPAGFARMVRETLSRPEVIAGAFRLRIDSPRRSLRIVETFANFRSSRLQAPYGDQALFLRADCFRASGGFPEVPIMEDFAFVRRLRRMGRISLAPAAAVTSARRWEQLGVLRTTLINQVIILAYLLGVSPERLARWYRGADVAGRNSSQEAQKHERWSWQRHFLLRASSSLNRSYSGGQRKP